MEEIRKWYFNLEEFNPEVGFRFNFTVSVDNEVYKHLCEVTECEKEKRLTCSWKYDTYPGNSFVTWELKKQGDKTLLKITHTDLESFAANSVNLTAKSFMGG